MIKRILLNSFPVRIRSWLEFLATAGRWLTSTDHVTVCLQMVRSFTNSKYWEMRKKWRGNENENENKQSGSVARKRNAARFVSRGKPMESKWTSITSVNHAESDETISSRLTPAGQEKSKSIRVKMSQRCNEEKRWRKRNKGKALCGHFVKYQVITFHPSTETEFQILNYVQHCIPLTILQRYLLLCPFHFTKVNSYEIIFPFNLLSSEFLPWITHCSSTVCLP